MAAPCNPVDEDVFGNSNLFEEFSTTVESCKHRKERRDISADSIHHELKAKIQSLEAKNFRLQSLLKMCIQSKGYKVSEGTQDGPIAQVVYMNHDSVCQYRQHIEQFFEGFCADAGQKQQASKRPLPQRSSVLLTEDTDPESQQAFTATGNVQYFMSFCLDPMGCPLVDGTPELTEGWEIPIYPIIFREALPVDDKPSAPARPKRAKASCFNCGDEGHSLSDCPNPRDQLRISQNRKQFMNQTSSPANTISGRRYHKDGGGGPERGMDEKFKKFKPGEISDALRQAMGISANQLPPYIYGMRRLGYPPGHLLDAQVHKSDLKVYNIKDTDEEGEVGSDEEGTNGDAKMFYNFKKFIDYPGFNVDADQSMQDEWRRYNSMPMQNCHRIEVLKLRLKPMEAEEEFLTPSNKRRNRSFHESSSSKKRRIEQEAVDMDLSDMDDGLSGTPARIEFQPPLPPTPVIATPPPLPPGSAPPTPCQESPMNQNTPSRGWFQPPLPPTPDMATPPPLPPGSAPPTPLGESPLVSRSSSAFNSQSSSRSGSPELDRLMMERTKLLAALDGGEESSMASASDAVASSTSSTVAEDGSQDEDIGTATGNGRTKDNGGDVGESDPELADKDSPDSPEPEAGKSSLNASQLTSSMNTTRGDSSVFTTSQEGDDDDDEELPNRSGVPHRRKFSVNITPHDFEADEPKKKGIFKKLLSILKR